MIATASPPLTQTPLPLRAAPVQGYFEKPGPAAFILGSFVAVAVPMALVTLLADGPAAALLTWAYIWLFGITHFVVTLSIYGSSANLAYFKSSPKLIAIFFAVPVLIFVTFDLIHALRVSTLWPTAALVFFGMVRGFDFFHLNRQTFGVLQMFKGRTKTKYPAPLRSAENRCLLAFVALLMTTYLAGGVCPLLQAGGLLSLMAISKLEGGVAVAGMTTLQVAWIAAAFVTAFLFVQVLRGHRQMAKANPNRDGFHAATLYMVLQCAGAFAASLYLPLYLAALAMHYVEYHVLMLPRCLHSKLNPDSTVDRAFGRLRSSPAVFYAFVLLAAAVVTGGAFIGMNAAMGMPISDFATPVGGLMLIALFDGIFVFHYFVEMYIWKFSDPHFRTMLAGLYFTPSKS